MTEPEVISILAALVLVIASVALRRHLFSWSSVLGYYFLANLISGFVGVLLLPWALDGRFLTDELERFRFLRWDWVTDDDLSNTIILYVGGALLAALGFRVASLVRESTTPRASTSSRELDVNRLLVLLTISLLFVGVHVAMHPEIFLAGIRSQLLSDDKGQLYEFRRASTSSYAFVLVAYNILPFLSTAVWLRARTRGAGIPFVIFSLFAIGASIIIFVLTFLKLPLMIFLIGLTATEIGRQRPDGGKSAWQRLVRLAAVTSVATGLFVTVQGMLRSRDTASDPVRVLVQDILARVSLSAPSYVHYFPKVAPHYGFSGISLVASLLGKPLYEVSAIVYQYSTYDREGSSTVASILEFYCSLGWAGWIVGNVLVGVLLQGLEHAISRVPAGDARLMARVFAFVFCVHLAEASFYSACLGYGGILFLSAWLAIFPHKNPTVARPAAVLLGRRLRA
jgi:hypothetical protein